MKIAHARLSSWYRLPGRRAVLAATVGLLAAAGCQSPEVVAPEAGSLRYSLAHASPSVDVPLDYAVADIDGDGYDELIKVVASETPGYWYMVIERVTPRGKRDFWTGMYFKPMGLLGALDLTGDGRPEVVRWRQTTQGTIDVDVLAYVTAGASVRADTLATFSAWNVAGSLLPTGDWPGDIRMAAAVDRDGDGVRERLVLLASASVRGYPRGVWSFDWRARDTAWGVETGATPTGEVAIADLDGDGGEDIVVGLESPGNGVAAEKWDDRHAYLAAFGGAGELLWSRELAGSAARVSVAAADLDGDGDVEVVSGVGGRSEGGVSGYKLAVRRGRDGSLLDDVSFGAAIEGVVIAETMRGSRIFAACADGRLRRLVFDGRELSSDGELTFGSGVRTLALVSFAPVREDPVLLVVTGRGVVAALDRELRLLAAFASGEFGADAALGMPAATFRTDGGPAAGALVGTGRSLHFLRLARNPLPVAWRVGIAVCAVLAVIAAVPRLRLFGVALARRTLVRGADREERLEELLGSLGRASHGMLKATRAFRRLHDQVAALAGLDGGPPAKLEERFMLAVGQVRDVALPTLRRIAKLAGDLGLAPEHASKLPRLLAAGERAVSDLGRELPPRTIADALERKLASVVSPIDEALDAIRRAARRERSVVLARELERTLRQAALETSPRGILLDLPDLAALGDVRVFVTPDELEFVMDNLIDNAVRAVEGVRNPRIAVSCAIEDGEAVVVVADSGCGIAPHRHERIFEMGVTEKRRGGRGLAESRAILSRRDGGLKLVRSVPGEGSVFEVRLSIVR